MPESRAIRPASRRYLALIQRFPLRPIETDDELTIAAELVDSLVMADNLTPDEDAYLDVLVILVERYEDKHYPIP